MMNGKQFFPKTADKNHSSSEMVNNFQSLERYNWLMHMFHVNGEIDRCKELIKKEIARSNGKNEVAFYKQGEILKEEGKLQEALESFQTCLKLNPESVDNMKEVAKCLLEMKRYKLAADVYLQAERNSKSSDWQIYFYSAQCHLKLGDIPKAKAYAQKAVQMEKDEMCYALLLKVLTQEGDLKAAIAVSDSAVMSCPDSINLLTESGLLNLKAGQTQQAFERLSATLALEPTCVKALLALGYVTQKHEEYDVALSKYKMAVNYEPDSVALWNNIGMCFYGKQKYVAAISCLKKALWAQPLNWRILYNLSMAHLATKQPASAFNYACAAVNLRPNVADCFALLAYTLMELHDPYNASLAMQQAVQRSPSDPILLINAAICYFDAGERDKATEMLAKFENAVEAGTEGTQEIIDALNLAERLSSRLKPEKLRTGSVEAGMADDKPASGNSRENNPGKAALPRELQEDEV
ncbi:unnamed protein product [Acanthoscelides obtectus]|uniref:Bardet-Biedl syndrome 4 protein n=1 Tax=Acanthoscelides obtectus TaxID=200917 RepID=A0A9P0MKZ2_ACAOB|nr:unnamed protein product [Acanthoscelides obtectus]CAK1676038.1 Bardet-Biedl syndrome 4 protein homolog [Acanthoscelides obtectus]